jgi:hypothetical protein
MGVSQLQELEMRYDASTALAAVSRNYDERIKTIIQDIRIDIAGRSLQCSKSPFVLLSVVENV